MAAEAALARRANRLLVCDTDLLTTVVWSEFLFGSCPRWIREQAGRTHYDLTLLLDVDVPWVDDSQRYLPHRRHEFFAAFRDALDRRDERYLVVRGGWEERFRASREAVETVLQSAGRP